MRFSASMIDKWMTCPLQAKFRYVDKMYVEGSNAKAVFGTCIHHALEIYNTTRDIERAINEFKRTWTSPELLRRDTDQMTWPKYTTFGSLMESGIEALRSYAEKNKWERRQVIATEHAFNVPFGDHTLSGFVDLLELKKSAKGFPTLRIVDYKTNGRAPNRTELFLNVQFTVYMYASTQPEFWMGNPAEGIDGLEDGEKLYEQQLELPRRAIWYGILQYKEFDAGDRDDNDFMRLYRVCNEIAGAIENKVFVPRIGGDSCMFCDYKEPCGLGIPTPDHIAKEQDGFFQ